MSFQIAIDGPVASGKGTVARLVAERLDFLYIDTGAMYRTTALLALRNKVQLNEYPKILELISQAKIELRNPLDQGADGKSEKDGRLTTVLLNGEDVSWAIRTEEMSSAASQIAVSMEIRQFLVSQQQKIAENASVVMEGRDISSRVLPHANLKIYLTADAKKRAERRLQDLLNRGEDVTLDSVYEEVKQRDQRDMERQADPLHIGPDVWVLDTTNLSIEQTVETIVQEVNKMTKG